MIGRTLWRHLAWLLAVAAFAAACSSSPEESTTIRLLTHDDFHVPQEAIDDFTTRTGVDVVIFREADPTAMADLLARSRTTPVADVVIGIDTLELARVIDDRLVEPYRPIVRDPLDEALLVEDDWMIPVSTLDTCLNRSISFYLPPERAPDELPDPDDVPPPIPASFGDLIDPAHSGTFVFPDARTSRMGLYFLAALERQFPEDAGPETLAWPQFLDLMLRQDARMTSSWEEAYFSNFLPGTDTTTDAEAGPSERPLTWGSAGMPSVTVRFQPDLPETVDVAVLNTGCVRVVNYAGIVAGTPNRLNAGRLVDSMVEPLFQFGIPDRFGSRPARTDIVRTDAWREFGVEVNAASLDPVDVGARWPVWQLTWNQIVTEFEEGEEPIAPEVTVTIPQ